jgi:hypothetical protein
MGLYCEDSWSLGWGHVWVSIIFTNFYRYKDSNVIRRRLQPYSHCQLRLLCIVWFSSISPLDPCWLDTNPYSNYFRSRLWVSNFTTEVIHVHILIKIESVSHFLAGHSFGSIGHLQYYHGCKLYFFFNIHLYIWNV